ncbi:PIR protein [Plasmodium yoelii]|uniref:PIR protein n=2 Tax=Plasmodium yoelii TaxID=5861 RepID=A0AAE9WTT0_PLAYO|nr:PIR protein [Plasmodium yoelii]WBY58359.1 PIR protein [Plasmodium yoelii yoelii]CDS44335.1 YIR protein [Plasmodium yoelii]VTZ79275.1 PIR protein [Plasmodium yoelii]|eukprot:XP_022810833.1 PIR protein [Plasmodium yoelii]
MLNSRVCGEFESIWKIFPDDLNASGEYSVGGGTIKNYCPNRKCDSDINKIDAGCLWLFNQFYGGSYNFSNYADDNIHIVVFIMIWLGYKLNQKLNKEFPNLKDFYSKHIQNANEYNKTIDDVEGYISYIDLINKNDNVINISNENMSKLYDLFKNLCKMYNDISKISNNNKKYIEYANKFADEYKKLFNDNDNNVEGSSYKQILSRLSSEYTYFRNSYVKSIKQGTIPELITEKTTQISVSNHEGTQDVSLSEMPISSSEIEVSSSKDKVSDSDSGSPSSSILNKLISIPFIFVATLILLGIAYKYSLFGIRKRSQKQHLRNKLKK